MKRLLFIVLLMAIGWSVGQAQMTKTYKLSFSENDFEFVEEGWDYKNQLN